MFIQRVGKGVLGIPHHRLEYIASVLKLHDFISLNAFESILKDLETELLGYQCLN